jgi:prepilin-type processing-associated H-X9-DG protein
MKLQRMNKRSRALTLIEVLVVIFGVMVVLGLFLLQPRSHAKGKAVRINCASNLKQIGLAFRTWENDNNNHFPMQGFTNQLGVMEFPIASNVFRYFQVMSNQLVNPKILVCPSDKRTEADSFAVLSNNNLSYFVGLDADESYPSMPLTGDRNLVVDGVSAGPGLWTLTSTNQVGWSAKMHNFGGNVGLADGSVQQLTSSGLQRSIANSGTNVNRLAVP